MQKNIPLSIIPMINLESIVKEQRSNDDFVPNLSLYIHFPFCMDKCPFCPIKVEKYDELLVNSYLLSLNKEISNSLKMIGRCKIDCIHFGGGTPSLLKNTEIDSILNTIKKYVEIEQTEILIEAHPAFISKNMIKYLSDINNCTLNFGVQSFNDNVLKSMKRYYNSAEMKKIISFSQDVGCKIGIDYICDWGGIDNAMLENDMKCIQALLPDHISQYPLRSPNLLHNILSSDKDVYTCKKINLNGYCEKRLLEMGYSRYSVFHYQKGDFISHKYGRNQLNGGKWLGFGANAYTYLGDRVYVNSSIFDYIKGETIFQQWRMNDTDHILWDFLFFIRSNPLYRNDVVNRYGAKIGSCLEIIIDTLFSKQYISSNENIALTWKGIINLDEVEKIINKIYKMKRC